MNHLFSIFLSFFVSISWFSLAYSQDQNNSDGSYNSTMNSTGVKGSLDVSADSSELLGIISTSSQMPLNAHRFSKGNIVSISRGDSSVIVRDTQGLTRTHRIKDPTMLDQLNPGDSVQLFSYSGEDI